jgi:APA family basic amino acid/polyamine antiporter
MAFHFRPRSVGELVSGRDDLHRVLSGGGLVMLGIGAVIGAGIFVLTGQVAAVHTGPAIVLSFLLAGTACGLAALCYSELASMIPVAGSAYTYASATLGTFVAWIIGWDLVLEYSVAASAVASGWSGYLVSFAADFGIVIPERLTQSIFDNPAGGLNPDGLIDLPAAVIVLLLSVLLALGVRLSSLANGLIVIIKLAVIIGFIVVGAHFIDPDNWRPFIPDNTGNFGEFGWSGVLRGAGIIFFAYIGFDAVSTAAQETRNPARDMPVGIIGSLAICTILYILVSIVLVGVVPYEQLNVAAPIALAVDYMGLTWFTPFIKIGAIAGLTSVMMVLLLGQSRIFYAIARDGLLPAWIGRVHPRRRTPYLSTFGVGIVVATVAALVPLRILGELVSIGTLFAFVIVCLGVMVLRYTQPNHPRAFRVPFAPFLPAAGVIICLYMMAGLPADTWMRLVAWLVIGLLIYAFYGARRAQKLRTGQGLS